MSSYAIADATTATTIYPETTQIAVNAGDRISFSVSAVVHRNGSGTGSMYIYYRGCYRLGTTGALQLGYNTLFYFVSDDSTQRSSITAHMVTPALAAGSYEVGLCVQKPVSTYSIYLRYVHGQAIRFR